jgi:glycopeptide antibiotics resistance protein
MDALARNPLARLKLSAVAFAVLWTGWMLWWSGSFDRANVIILTICGIVAGYVWYRCMRWYFQRTCSLPRN